MQETGFFLKMKACDVELGTLRKENVVASLRSTPDTYWTDKSMSIDTPVLKEVHNCYGADFCQELIRMGCSVSSPKQHNAHTI